MRVPGCDECARLWEKYTDATFDFVKLDAQLKMAALRYESSLIMARLTERSGVAAQCRDAALEGLKQQKATHQMRSAAAS
jgi:hypothetical protein